MRPFHIVVSALLLVLVFIGMTISRETPARSRAPAQVVVTPYPRTIEVEYRVTGTDLLASVQWRTPQNAPHLAEAKIALPWDATVRMAEDNKPYLRVTRSSQTGTIRCELLIDGVSVAKDETDRQADTAACFPPLSR